MKLNPDEIVLVIVALLLAFVVGMVVGRALYHEDICTAGKVTCSIPTQMKVSQ